MSVAVVIEKELTEGQNSVDDVDIGQLRVINGCCCGITSLYCDWPACVGAQYAIEALCLKCKAIKCKPSKEKGQCCTILEAKCVCTKPKTCLGLQCQCFCCDTRAALPCTAEVPCICGALGLVLCYKKKCKPSCCKKLMHIDPAYSKEQVVEIPTQQAVITQSYGSPSELKDMTR